MKKIKNVSFYLLKAKGGYNFHVFFSPFNDCSTISDSIRDGLQFEQRKMEFGHLVFLFHRRMIATLSFIDGLSLTSMYNLLIFD